MAISAFAVVQGGAVEGTVVPGILALKSDTLGGAYTPMPREWGPLYERCWLDGFALNPEEWCRDDGTDHAGGGAR